ncbi:outer membrane beta-barrel protein [Photobacterium leiognathi]|uniref:outer membrane beta-barrel protein n=1 Tax=Photobacterium leiognathi TaxID=553611 RepID=UPI002981A793|nr:outer membrane beta-barrel protein [Photobacterium leiognathi]
MKNKKFALAALVGLFGMTGTASAALPELGLSQKVPGDIYAGAQYQIISDDVVDLGSATLVAGYKHQLAPKIAVGPELKLGFGIGDDQVGSNQQVELDLSLNTMMSAGVRGEYQFNEKFKAFTSLTYANFDLEATLKDKVSGQSASASDDQWEFGYGVGLSYEVVNNLDIVTSYETYASGDIDLLSIGLSYKL